MKRQLRIPLITAMLALAGGALAVTTAGANQRLQYLPNAPGGAKALNCELSGRPLPYAPGSKITVTDPELEKTMIYKCVEGPYGAEWNIKTLFTVEEISKAKEEKPIMEEFRCGVGEEIECL